MEQHLLVSLPSDPPRRRIFTANHYLIVLLIFIISAPFIEELGHTRAIEGVLLSAVLLSALSAAGRSRGAYILGLLLVIPALSVAWINRLWPGAIPMSLETIGGLLFIGFVVVQLLHFILTAKRVSMDVLSASMAGYLTIGIFWSFAYILLAEYKPNAFAYTVEAMPEKQMRRFQAIYFSLVTLTTTGYGDIVPINGIARMMATLEAICGTFYLTVLVARLVSLYSSKDAQETQT